MGVFENDFYYFFKYLLCLVGYIIFELEGIIIFWRFNVKDWGLGFFVLVIVRMCVVILLNKWIGVLLFVSFFRILSDFDGIFIDFDLGKLGRMYDLRMDL